MIACTLFMLREIEASTALASNVSVQDTRQGKRAVWWLPASKTDVMAKSTSLSWGCTCSAEPSSSTEENDYSLGKACAYHALIRQLELLEDHFGPAHERSPELPLFPDLQGNPVSKEAMVRTIEHFAGSVGEPLVDERGRRRMGGHSFRVAGAKHLARIGVEVFVIQLLARHSTSIILRYVSEVPLESLTERYKRSAQNRDLEQIITSMETSKADHLVLEDHLQELKMNVREMATNELRSRREHKRLDSENLMAALQDRVNSLERKVPSEEYVVNTKSGAYHLPGNYHRRSMPLTWRTNCGWGFGQVRHFRWDSSLPSNKKLICEVCMPEMSILNADASDESS